MSLGLTLEPSMSMYNIIKEKMMLDDLIVYSLQSSLQSQSHDDWWAYGYESDRQSWVWRRPARARAARWRAGQDEPSRARKEAKLLLVPFITNLLTHSRSTEEASSWLWLHITPSHLRHTPYQDKSYLFQKNPQVIWYRAVRALPVVIRPVQLTQCSTDKTV